MITAFLLIFMAVLPDQFKEVADGDQAFYRVDTRRPPHELETGVAADAVNCRFEDGRAWPRYGVNQQAWGAVMTIIPVGTKYGSTVYRVALRAGYKYTITLKRPVTRMFASTYVGTVDSNIQLLNPPIGQPLTFTAPAAPASFYVQDLNSLSGLVLDDLALAYVTPPKTCGYARFNDPDGYDTQVLLVDDWRDQNNEDGGRGRAFRIQSGNLPLEVPLNGNDVWGTCRLVPCYNGLVLLRQGNERHYFSAAQTLTVTNTDSTLGNISCATTTLQTGSHILATSFQMQSWSSGGAYARVVSAGTILLYDTAAHAIAGGPTGLLLPLNDGDSGTLTRDLLDTTNHRIQLNCAPNWNNGDRVVFYADNTLTGGSYFSGASPPQNATAYFVKNITGNQIELYRDQGLNTQVVFTSAHGRFWIERSADFPGFYGNAAPPLLGQPNGSGNTIWETGFNGVPVNVVVTTTASATNLVTAPNHRLLPGDHVNVTGLHKPGPVAITDAYVYPVSPNVLAFYTTQAGALAQDATTIIAQVGSETGTIVKAGASGLPMPGGREGAYYQNRLIIVNGRDTLAISDALDPLHFTPFEAAVTANLGESSQIMAVWPLGTNDAVLVLRENEVEILNNFSGGPSAWTLTSLTREYGCIAPLTVAQVGNDVWFLSRKGVASITQTQNGVLQGVADPVSKAMKKYIDLIDWTNAGQACAGYWNNRYFVAVPLKGQSGTIQNNGVLSHCFLNSGTIRGAQDGVYHFETMFGWEGLWQGAALQPVAFARLKVFGDERICFVTGTGQVGWFGDGFMDGTTPIETTLVTRRYTDGNQLRKLWLSGLVTMDSYSPNLTVTAIYPGVNETQALVANKTYDGTSYGVWGQPAYNPATATPTTFNAPFRGDYPMSAGELLAGTPDLHQNHPLPLRLRRLKWGVQLQITNIAGSARIGSVQVGGTLRGVMSASEDNA